MAYTRVNWEDGEKTADGYVTINGQNYPVVEPTYSGATAVDSTNLNIMDKGIKEIDNCRLKKLWENSNPSEDFGAQTINLSSSDYDYLIWIFVGYKGQNQVKSVISPKGYGANMDSSDRGGTGNQVRTIQRRIEYVSDTVYQAPQTSVYTNGSSTITYSNGSCVPLFVYGGKF